MLATSDTEEARLAIKCLADVSLSSVHLRLEVDFEHGQNFVTCLDCGAQWSANDRVAAADADVPAIVNGRFTDEYMDVVQMDFEEVSHGDESCTESEG